ncbi:MAG TPA: TatD family hydrolase [Candidatus Nanoarchaeia archaeon]|nr:TatD family hydrolase [Candidatus Nanoarchaeia archaeon]
MLVDVHAHLHLPQFNEDRAEVIKRASNVLIIENGLDPESNRKVLELSKKFLNVKAALGFYPTHVIKLSEKQFEDELKFVAKNSDKIAAIGEVGLDFQDIEDKKLQIERFGHVIKLAKKLNKPLIVHSRKAEKETLEFLETFNYKKINMHCFCGNKKLLKKINDLNFYMSIPPNVIRSQQFQIAIETININNLLTETDCPYLSPFVGKRNEPAFVIESIKKIAEIKKFNLVETENNIFMNFQKLFSK